MEYTPDKTRVPTLAPATTPHRFSGAMPLTGGVQGTSVPGAWSVCGFVINVVGTTQGNAQGPAPRGRPV